MRLLERYLVLITVQPLLILGPDDPNGLVKAGKLYFLPLLARLGHLALVLKGVGQL